MKRHEEPDDEQEAIDAAYETVLERDYDDVDIDKLAQRLCIEMSTSRRNIDTLRQLKAYFRGLLHEWEEDGSIEEEL
jgi:hypothetical protein